MKSHLFYLFRGSVNIKYLMLSQDGHIKVATFRLQYCVFSQYILKLVIFTISARKQDCVWLYFVKTNVVGKAVCQAICKKCRDQSTQI